MAGGDGWDHKDTVKQDAGIKLRRGETEEREEKMTVGEGYKTNNWHKEKNSCEEKRITEQIVLVTFCIRQRSVVPNSLSVWSWRGPNQSRSQRITSGHDHRIFLLLSFFSTHFLLLSPALPSAEAIYMKTDIRNVHSGNTTCVRCNEWVCSGRCKEKTATSAIEKDNFNFFAFWQKNKQAELPEPVLCLTNAYSYYVTMYFILILSLRLARVEDSGWIQWCFRGAGLSQWGIFSFSSSLWPALEYIWIQNMFIRFVYHIMQ